LLFRRIYIGRPGLWRRREIVMKRFSCSLRDTIEFRPGFRVNLRRFAVTLRE
jgi:hypothetical protein